MKPTQATTGLPLADEDWARVLTQLRANGFTPVESIKVTRAVLNVTLGEAKRIVHDSAAWADARPTFEALHDELAAAVGRSGPTQ
jgi:ribosomal protein L7/L12